MGQCSPRAVVSSCPPDPALLLDLFQAQPHLLLLKRYRLKHTIMTAAVTDAAHNGNLLEKNNINNTFSFQKYDSIYYCYLEL